MTRFTDPEKQRLWIQKISESRRGKCTGDANPSKRKDVRQKISDKLKGRDAIWLLGEKNPAKRLEAREKIRNNKNSKATRFQKGNIPKNKGRTSQTDESVEIGRVKRLGRTNTEEQNKHIRNGLPLNHGDIARENALNNMLTGKWPSNSSSEDEFEKILIEEIKLIKDRDFFHPYRIDNYMFDFFIVNNRGIIEIDGKEHKHDRKIKEKDKLKEECLKRHGHLLIRFPNEEILSYRREVIEKIKTFIKSDVLVPTAIH